MSERNIGKLVLELDADVEPLVRKLRIIAKRLMDLADELEGIEEETERVDNHQGESV